MRSIVKISLVHYAFFAILLLQCFFWGINGSYLGITGDEIFSYGLSNNTEEYIFWDNNTLLSHTNENGWINGKDIFSYMTVEKDNTFSFDRVWWNQQMDVHPPLYYIIFNIVCSLTPETLSIWQGRLISIFFLALAEIFMFKLLLYFTHKELLCLCMCTIYGSTSGAYFLSSYIRMYSLLVFICLGFIYFFFKHIDEPKNRVFSFLLGLFVFLGGLSHYYSFLMVAIICFFSFFVFLYFSKMSIIQLVKAFLPIIIGGLSGVLIFPRMLYHIFLGPKADDVRNGITSSSLPIKKYIDHINSVVFNNCGSLIIVILAILIFYILISKKHVSFKSNMNFSYLIILILSGLSYLMIIAKIFERPFFYYTSPAQLTLYVCFSVVFIYIIDCCFIKKSFFILLFVTVLFTWRYSVEMLLAQPKSKEDFTLYELTLKENRESDIIFIYDNWDNIFSNQISYLAYGNEILCINGRDLEIISSKIIDTRITPDGIIIFYPKELENAVLDVITHNLNKNPHFICTYGKYSILLL